MPQEADLNSDDPVYRALWAQAVESILLSLTPDEGAAFLRHMAEGLVRERIGPNVVEVRSWQAPEIRKRAALVFREELPRFARVVARS